MYRLVEDDKTLSDIFAARQEYAGRRDRRGRFLGRYSTHINSLEPVVSSHLISAGLLDPNWPDNHSFAACLTHDVDFIYPTWTETFFAAAELTLRMNPKRGVRRLLTKLRKDKSSSPYRTFDRITKIEAAYGAKSSFYFKATPTATLMDRFYDLADLRGDFTKIADAGSEIGLHLGYYSFDSLPQIASEKERLEKALGCGITGVRIHTLRFSVPDTWKILARAGFEYDTTFGYPDMPGFRNGMVHPFTPYDLDLQKDIDILEIPLTVMDKTLMDLGFRKASAIINGLITTAERNKGVITILWHNNMFDELYRGTWIRLYERILATLRKRNAWMTSAEEIRDHWSRKVHWAT